MANNAPEIYAADDFLEQILAIPSYASLPVTDISAGASSENSASGISQLQQQPLFPLGLSLDNGFADANNTGGFQVKTVSVLLPQFQFVWHYTEKYVPFYLFLWEFIIKFEGLSMYYDK